MFAINDSPSETYLFEAEIPWGTAQGVSADGRQTSGARPSSAAAGGALVVVRILAARPGLLRLFETP
jgi:hypothetical protein